MNKKMLIIVFIIIAIAGGVIFLSRDTTTKSTDKETTVQTQESAATTPSDEQAPSTTQPGQYVDYQENLIATTPGTKILFFHAAWCPQCRTLERDINTGEIPSNVTIIKVDYDTSQALRQKYGVTLQTTLVKVADDGSLVKKYVAYDDPTLASLKANLL